MPVNRFETFEYIVGGDTRPIRQGKQLLQSLVNFYQRLGSPQQRRVLIAGSGQGVEVVTFGLAFKTVHMVTLDCNVELNPEVRTLFPGRLEEDNSLFHEYLLAGSQPFDTIVISTGPTHGITEQKEYDALAQAVSEGGLILLDDDSELREDLLWPTFKMINTSVPSLTTGWIKIS